MRPYLKGSLRFFVEVESLASTKLKVQIRREKLGVRRSNAVTVGCRAPESAVSMGDSKSGQIGVFRFFSSDLSSALRSYFES